MDRPTRVLKETIYHVTCPCGNEFTEASYDDEEEEKESVECTCCGASLALPSFMGEFAE